ncbi:hypothetical protein D1AOALGA4SA_2385 [Olavius algarvensis Delta 1 endosymbiont]|nr:hypothetical protein D1AOALGA4SA_2385 [Olavius algarvensis Delta 1 endosymbiont]
MIEHLTSTFMIPCSIFDICFLKFLFRLDRPFFGQWSAFSGTPEDYKQR